MEFSPSSKTRRDFAGVSEPGSVTAAASRFERDLPRQSPAWHVTENVSCQVVGSPVESRPILSMFPGADLLGRGFEEECFCVVRGPDLVWGGDIRRFRAPRGAFVGIIGGPPCQDFSALRRSDPTGYGLEMLGEWCRVVMEAAPDWFLMENTPRVPSIQVPGYVVQRFNLSAKECGGRQSRLRTFQFGSRDGVPLVIEREASPVQLEPACIASEASRPGRRTWADFCELQGLPRDFDIPGLSVAAKYRAVGNGVPVYMARVISRAIRARTRSHSFKLCACGCGRPVSPRATAATPACRKRLERGRKAIGSASKTVPIGP